MTHLKLAEPYYNELLLRHLNFKVFYEHYIVGQCFLINLSGTSLDSSNGDNNALAQFSPNIIQRPENVTNAQQLHDFNHKTKQFSPIDPFIMVHSKFGRNGLLPLKKGFDQSKMLGTAKKLDLSPGTDIFLHRKSLDNAEYMRSLGFTACSIPEVKSYFNERVKKTDCPQSTKRERIYEFSKILATRQEQKQLLRLFAFVPETA